MSFTERRAAALNALSRRPAATPPRYPGETQPSGDLPDDPWLAKTYLAQRDWSDDEGTTWQDGATQ